MSENEKCLDRSCFLFVLQGIISLLVMVGCFIMIMLDIESAYAQSILTLFVGVWLPSPSVTPITQTELTRPLASRAPVQESSHSRRTSQLPTLVSLTSRVNSAQSSVLVPTEIKNHESETKEA
jgi:hypothetical protein